MPNSRLAGRQTLLSLINNKLLLWPGELLPLQNFCQQTTTPQTTVVLVQTTVSHTRRNEHKHLPEYVKHSVAKLKNKKPLKSGFLFECGASNEVRTRDLDLGKVALYQLSYTRIGQRCCVVMARILQNQRSYASTLCW
jgi:hypothetical protein